MAFRLPQKHVSENLEISGHFTADAQPLAKKTNNLVETLMEVEFSKSASGRIILTRDDLYDLVWEMPMTKLAKRLGLSDVGLKKVCNKLEIPTPARGYWAKVASGKPAHKKYLPEFRESVSARLERLQSEADAAVVAETETATSTEPPGGAFLLRLESPKEFHARLHPTVALCAKHIRESPLDRNGMKHCQQEDAINLTVSPATCDRALAVLDYIVSVRGSSPYVGG